MNQCSKFGVNLIKNEGLTKNQNKGIKMNINIGRMRRKKRIIFLIASVKTRIGSAGIHAFRAPNETKLGR